ncbi:MAG: hypothetical protein KGM16_05910 [Bacteroidota bacterium]|nr:hypothetical protein [Bacteroidota bacterium]
MQRIKIGLMAVLTIMSISFVYAQNADEIINHYVDAIGGKDNLSKVNTVSMEASSQVMGNDNPVVVDIINGKGYKSVTDFNGQQFVRAYTDKGGWTINPFAGGSDPVALSPEEYKSVKEDMYIGGALYEYAVNHTGTATLEGTDGGAYKIKYTSPDSIESTYYIDTASYLLTKMMRQGQMQGQSVDVTTTLSDYQKTPEGISIPYTTNVDFGGNFSMSTTIKKVEINKTIDPSIFEMPK